MTDSVASRSPSLAGVSGNDVNATLAARAGMTSSPLWRGGGRIFPNKPDENFSQKLNRKMYRAGMASILSQLVREDRLSVIEAFSREENPLSGGGKWTRLSWANYPGRVAGSGTTGGWGPSEAFPTINGAYWNPTSYRDEGSGAAVAATLSVSPANAERWFSLWLNMSEPGLVESGYELRFTQTATANTYNVTLSKWVSGMRTVLATASSYAFAPQSSFALVDTGGTVSAWIDSGSGFTQLLYAGDATYSSGYTGIEGAGNITRIRNFKAG